MTTPHVLIIGGGVAGLTAAHRIRQLAGSQVRVTVAEQARQLGGKLRSTRLAGVPVETGAESFLVRRPEAVDLVDTLGLADQLVHPARHPAAIYSYGQLHGIPKGTLQGVPSDPSALAGIVSPQAAARPETVASGPFLTEPDATVGALVRRAFGDEVSTRLVDPMLGGVYAGRADDLSVAVTMPGLAAAARDHDRLSAAVTQCLLAGSTTGTPSPVFGALTGGMSQFVDALATAGGAEILLGQPIRELHRTPLGWQAVRGETREPELIDADAVVLAVPARPAARLLGELDASAAGDVAQLDYASVALVALAYRDITLPQLSGFLVPAMEGLAVKAVTFVTQKWPHLGGGDITIVRASMGRYGQEHLLQRDDAELAALAHAEISTLTNRTLPPPQTDAVFRWGGGLPQYAPGHRERVDHARRRLDAHPLALAGAAYDGVGIPACVASGQAAARRLLDPAVGAVQL